MSSECSAMNYDSSISSAADGTMFWERESKVMAEQPWKRRQGRAQDIELTAYALLTLANKGDIMNGPKVLKWLTEQRNPHGGFSSTQVCLSFKLFEFHVIFIIFSDMDFSLIFIPFTNCIVL